MSRNTAIPAEPAGHEGPKPGHAPLPAGVDITTTAGYKHAAPEEAQELVENQGYQFLDVRTPEEHQAGSAPGTINVPLLFRGPDGTPSVPNPAFLEQVQAALPDKTAGVVCSCQHGRRGEAATKRLAEAGFVNLANLVGGLHAWGEAGLPVAPTGRQEGEDETKE